MLWHCFVIELINTQESTKNNSKFDVIVHEKFDIDNEPLRFVLPTPLNNGSLK
jgi:hypothetical protein